MMPDSDFELHEAALDDDAPTGERALSWRTIALGALAAALVIAGIAWRMNLGTAGATTASRLFDNGTTVSLVSIVVQGTQLPLPPGWVNVDPFGAQVVRQNGNDSYVCGSPDGYTVFLAHLHAYTDNKIEAHWPSPGTFPHCTVAIDSQDAKKVAVGMWFGALGSSAARCYRSSDGGATFQPIELPEGNACDGTLQWVGDTLFAGRYRGAEGVPATPFTAAQPSLAKSVGGGPFAWVTVADGVSGVLANNYSLLGANGDAVYLRVTAIDQPQVSIIRSTDGGATWQPVSFTADHVTLTNVEIMPDDGILIAQGGTYLYTSADNGGHWMRSPALPAAPGYAGYVAPDGTVVTEFAPETQAPSTVHIYATYPGSPNWTLLAPQTDSAILTGIGWDATGRLTMLYGSVDPTGSLIEDIL